MSAQINGYQTLVNVSLVAVLGMATIIVGACSSDPPLPPAKIYPSLTKSVGDYNYLIGPLDTVDVFVWGNDEISGSFIVRPDGKITTSLVEDISVSGKTPSAVAREIENILSAYIRDPIVTVSVTAFNGPFSEQVRVIGEADDPQAIAYIEQMTLLDVIIQIEGLTEFADGNRATLARIIDGKYQTFQLAIEELIEGDIDSNVDVLPGDIIIIPEAWF